MSMAYRGVNIETHMLRQELALLSLQIYDVAEVMTDQT